MNIEPFAKEDLNIFPNRSGKVFFISLFFFLFFTAANTLPQTNEDCLNCHTDEELTMEKKGETKSLFVNDSHLKNSVHKKLNCISCHVGFSAEDIPHKSKIEPINCTTCHKDAGAKHPFHPQLLRAKGVNGNADVSCKGCHGTHNIISPKSTQSHLHASKIVDACSNCHKDEGKTFMISAHSRALIDGIKGAPNCISCHKSPITYSPGRDTIKVKIAQEKLCLSCHIDDPDVRLRVAPSAMFIKSYENSVHGQALLKGDIKAANCIDCHASHDVVKGSDESSTVHKFNVVNTCSKCHADIAKEYIESSHGKALLKRNIDSPTCTDCHGEHNIMHPSAPTSPVAFRNVSTKICAPCHSSIKLSDKYGLSTKRIATFSDSYHGLALRGGDTEAANCASCHGYHNIKPSTDSTSMIHKSNIVNTCGKCHPGANDLFAIGAVHVTLEKGEDPILYWIATIYLFIIFSTIGGMFLHNAIDFVKKAKRKKMMQRGLIAPHHYGRRLYLRMTLNERLQHFSLLTSFFTLVITGFMLRFPEAWWVSYIREIFPDSFIYRSLLHRIAAVVIVSASLYHIYYLAATQRGRQLFMDLLPKLQDAKDAIGVVKYNLGLSKEKPSLDRFSYIEKSEYWALVWGTAVMTLTGFVMWFENYFIGIFTKLGWDIARTIHYYEAWLAFLAILVWHIYFVIFNPDMYPMNLAWIKGTLSEEEMADEHPAELERIKQKEMESGKHDLDEKK